MRKSDLDFMTRICDLYASGYSNSLGQIAKKVGVSTASMYQWMVDPEIILPEYMGQQNVPFGRAMQMARNVSKMVTISESLEEFVRAGRKVQVFHHGCPSYVEDELFARSTPAERKALVELGVCWPDGLKRDKDLNRIILTKIEPCPAQLIERYAAANSSVYRDKIEVTSKDGGTSGVTTIGAARPIPKAFLEFASKADLEAGGAIEMIGDGGDPEIFSEPDASRTLRDADLDDLLGPEPVLTPVTDTPPPKYDPTPAPFLEPLPTESVIVVNRESLPPNYVPTSSAILQPKSVPAGWRAEYEKLMAKSERNSLPDRTDRG